jgi:hypothetical protein
MKYYTCNLFLYVSSEKDRIETGIFSCSFEIHTLLGTYSILFRYMLSKKYKSLQNQFVLGKINLLATARRLGYKGASLTKGINKVRGLLMKMGITVL